MKTKALIGGAILGVLLATAVRAENPPLARDAKELRIGVYSNGAEFTANGGQRIVEALAGAPGVKAEAIDTLAGETLRKYDVVVISGIGKLSPKDASNADLGIQGTDCVKTLVHFVDCGGGVILGHDSIGEYGPFGPNGIAPMVGRTYRRSVAAPNHVVKVADHPVMAGVPETFTLKYNHAKIVPGNVGQTLVTDEAGTPSLVVGEVSRGRVVEIGFVLGRNWQVSQPLSEFEVTLLLNAVKWAGARPKYEVPEKDTEAGLLAEVKGYAKQDEADQIAKYMKLPAPRFDEAVIWGPIMRPYVDTRAKIATAVENCKRMGFTKLNVIVKTGSYYYPSRLEPNEFRAIIETNYMFGACMIEEARKQGLQLSLVIFPFVSRDNWTHYLPNINAREYSQLQAGKLTLDKIDRDHKGRRLNGTICPDHPAVRERALKITQELIEMYHPEEIGLDYIRYKDGYDTSCYCDYSLARKAEFATQHPEIPKKQLDAKFAEESLVSFVTEWNKLCKTADPKVKTFVYTISSPNSKAPEWVNRYSVDWHQKYISRETSGPESRLDDTAQLMGSYHDWIESARNGARFSPLIASYNRKSHDRVLCEFKIASDAQDRQRVPFKRVEFYEYNMLVLQGNQETGAIDGETARAISDALGGTWGKQKE